jgi:hypothetical protein
MEPKVTTTENIFLEIPENVEKENWFASENLIEAARDAIDPGSVYGKDERKAGKVMAVLFDGGITLRNEKDFAKMGLLMEEVTLLAHRTRAFDATEQDIAARRRALAVAATALGIEQ